MLLQNDLLEYTHPSPRTVRILWIAPGQSHAYVFDVADRSAEAELVQLSALLAHIQAGLARVLPADPYLTVVSEERLPDKHLRMRARAWQIIGGLVAQQPEIYEARQRGALIAQVVRQHGVSHPTIYRYLRRYWQRGQTPNALLPDYGNSGGRGKVRQASAGVKRGRPRKDGAGAGLNVDDEMRRVFRVATARYAAEHPRFSRQGAYQKMLADFFVERDVDVRSGRLRTVQASTEQALPSFGQFNYWLDHDDDRPPQVARRARTALAPAAADALGLAPPAGRPGAAFYLDVLRADVLLVSRVDRRQTIGRPLLYMVSDTFSGMVCGIYIGMGQAQWQYALLAVANCGADKTEYVKQHGCHIEAAAWPCRHLPASLLVNAALQPEPDTGTLVNNFGVGCALAEDGPAPWRAVLEKRFRLLPPALDGSPSRLDGVLDLAQFTRIVIDCVLSHNVRGGPAAPCALWNWGLQQRGSALKTVPQQVLRCSLMPSAHASVTAAGIVFFGRVYTCAHAVGERWSERARLRGPWQVLVAYDPADLSVLYLRDALTPMQFHACYLADATATAAGGQASLACAELAHLPRGPGAALAPVLRTTTQAYSVAAN